MMNELILIVYLLPILFMIHDFEEIIFMKLWIKKNRVYLEKKFPVLPEKMFAHAEELSVPAFSLAVLEEFIIISLISITAIWFEYYYIWFALFMAFSIHLVIHLFQWLLIRKYIPAIVTTILILPYSIYGFVFILQSEMFSIFQMIVCTIAGLIFAGSNLILMHKVAAKFDKWRE